MKAYLPRIGSVTSLGICQCSLILEAVVYCSESAGAGGGRTAVTTYTIESSPIVLLAVHVKFPDDCSFTSVILKYGYQKWGMH